ncbi:MAG TPA: serine--tRNA ligase [Terriglobia bacterium]|nr:serine--tRNA ligase [Terriglobia bacterium]
MLDLNYLRDNLDEARELLARRGFNLDVDTFQTLDRERKQLLVETERLRQARNTASEEIAQLVREKADVTAKRNEVKAVGQKIKDLEDALRTAEARLFDFATVIPNLPDPAAPAGVTEEQNLEVRRVGEPRKFDFTPKAHWDIGPQLGILDMERGAKVTGARFYFLAGQGARLERALVSFMLDIQTRERGYTELATPYMVNRASMFSTGNLPKFEADLFWLKEPDYALIPTAEVPVTNLYRDEILDGARLPLKFTAFTPCFRSEAGSYGKDVRGIFRVHQFHKCELVKFCRPEESNNELEKLTSDAEEILKRLELPYRVVLHCAGDMGFGAAKGYDLEVWLPGQNTYREISSCSNFSDFQARRANIRYRPEPGAKPRLVHTLNGSGLAVGRAWIAIVENGQQADGTVVIPKALRPYLDGQDVIRPQTAI